MPQTGVNADGNQHEEFASDFMTANPKCYVDCRAVGFETVLAKECGSRVWRAAS